MQGARTWVEINKQALRGNIAALRSLLAPETQFSGVVKANAYGHGLPQVVPLLLEDGVAIFCVDSVEEAKVVRQLSNEATIIIIGYTLHDRLKDVIDLRAHQTVYDADTIRLLNEAAGKQTRVAKIHLKVETGTLRQGIWKQEVPGMLEIIRSCKNIELVGVSSHFADVEEAETSAYTDFQLDIFWEVCAMIQAGGFAPTYYHTASSAATILYPHSHGTMVRSGISIYGFWSSRQTRHSARLMGRRIELEPVLSWKTRIAQIKDAPMGTPIGYDCTEILRRHTKIALLPVGYYDGYDRRLSSVGEVIIRGQLCRVLGRVCMNMCMVDVTEVPRAALEDEVILIGRGGKNRMRADDLAQRANSVHYEITTRINPLIPRVIV